MFPVGFAYLDFERTGPTAHLWIVVCDWPEGDPDERIIFSITSDGPHVKDRSCEVTPSDHDFIKHKSFVLFRKGAIVTITDLTAWTSRGNIEVRTPASAELVARIRDAALKSPYVPRDVQAALRDCW